MGGYVFARSRSILLSPRTFLGFSTKDRAAVSVLGFEGTGVKRRRDSYNLVPAVESLNVIETKGENE